VSEPGEIDDMLHRTRELSAEARHALRSNLTILSLLPGQPSMPDPAPMRARTSRPSRARLEQRMHEDSIVRLQRRARGVRARALVRRWEYRQRHHAAGVWFRLRLLLTGAREALPLSEDEVRMLVGEGYTPDPAGADIAPARVLLVVDDGRARQLPPRPALPLRLGPEFFAAPAIALVPFEGVAFLRGGSRAGINDVVSAPRAEGRA
jgi:hypothetical protein